MIIFINILGGIPNTFNEYSKTIAANSYLDTILLLTKGTIIYLFIVFIIVLFQDAYKRINIVSAKQLNVSANNLILQTGELKNSYIPIKLNQGGILPLVFSSTVTTFLYYPAQLFLNSILGGSADSTSSLVLVYTVVINLLNIILVIFFSGFYALLVLKPNDISQNLAKMTYTIPGIRQGTQTTQFLKQTVTRLAFIGGLFLVFFPLLLGNVFQFSLFKNVTSLLILVGVITDTTAQIRGYIISRNYEGFKNP